MGNGTARTKARDPQLEMLEPEKREIWENWARHLDELRGV